MQLLLLPRPPPPLQVGGDECEVIVEYEIAAAVVAVGFGRHGSVRVGASAANVSTRNKWCFNPT